MDFRIILCVSWDRLRVFYGDVITTDNRKN